MDVENPSCVVGECLYLAKSDLIFKYGMENKISYWPIQSYNGLYLFIEAEWFRQRCLVRISSTNGISMPRTNIVL